MKQLLILGIFIFFAFLVIFFLKDIGVSRDIYNGIENSNSTSIPLSEQMNNTNVQVESMKIYDNEGIVIFRFNKQQHELKYLINTENVTTKDIVLTDNLVAAINSSYFLKDLSHAGLLKINGVILVNLAPLDMQLNGIVFWKDNDVGIVQVDKSIDLSRFYSAFQTGPIIILDSKIQNEFIKNSLNGETSHLRSIFGYDEDYYYFIYTSKPYKLIDVANVILQEIIKNNVNFINLDGGSSTSIYVSKDEASSFRSFKILPFYLGISLNYQTSML